MCFFLTVPGPRRIPGRVFQPATGLAEYRGYREVLAYCDGLGPRFSFTNREGWPSVGTNFPSFEVQG